jgi:hypothetical protein
MPLTALEELVLIRVLKRFRAAGAAENQIALWPAMIYWCGSSLRILRFFGFSSIFQISSHHAEPRDVR